jgi:adenylate kinase family enzyme
MGLPVISLETVFDNIKEHAGKKSELMHPFYLKVKEMLEAGDRDQLLKDKIALKILRLQDTAQDGFILTDFPNDVKEAELLEEFKGGMNSFVHLSFPDDVMVSIEEKKLSCNHCGRDYHPEVIKNEE